MRFLQYKIVLNVDQRPYIQLKRWIFNWWTEYRQQMPHISTDKQASCQNRSPRSTIRCSHQGGSCARIRRTLSKTNPWNVSWLTPCDQNFPQRDCLHHSVGENPSVNHTEDLMFGFVMFIGWWQRLTILPLQREQFLWYYQLTSLCDDQLFQFLLSAKCCRCRFLNFLLPIDDQTMAQVV